MKSLRIGRRVERSRNDNITSVVEEQNQHRDKQIEKEDERNEKEEIIETMRTPGWKYIMENTERTIEQVEKSIIRTKQLNAYNFMATPFFEDVQDWQQRGIILGAKYFLKSVQLTLNQRYSRKRISLLRGFLKGFKTPFVFVRNTKRQIGK